MYEATVEDFLRLAGVGGGASSGGGGGAKDNIYVVRMQGLPYRATEMEIVCSEGERKRERERKCVCVCTRC